MGASRTRHQHVPANHKQEPLGHRSQFKGPPSAGIKGSCKLVLESLVKLLTSLPCNPFISFADSICGHRGPEKAQFDRKYLWCGPRYLFVIVTGPQVGPHFALGPFQFGFLPLCHSSSRQKKKKQQKACLLSNNATSQVLVTQPIYKCVRAPTSQQSSENPNIVCAPTLLNITLPIFK